jgi:hypothetical protein
MQKKYSIAPKNRITPANTNQTYGFDNIVMSIKAMPTGGTIIAAVIKTELIMSLNFKSPMLLIFLTKTLIFSPFVKPTVKFRAKKHSVILYVYIITGGALQMCYKKFSLKHFFCI